MSKIQLTPLTHITPTMVNRLAVCPLQVGCDRDTALQEHIISSPASYLGRICHFILEEVGRGAIPVDAIWDEAFERLWTQEVTRLEQELMARPHLTPLGQIVRWPSYAIKKMRMKAVAHLLWSRQSVFPAGNINRAHHATLGGVDEMPELSISHYQRERQSEQRKQNIDVAPSTFLERRYQAFNGRMIGIIDVVRHTAHGVVIEDYKSGTVVDIDETTHVATVRDAYREQILLYAAMYHDYTGIWPCVGRLIPLDGNTIDFAIDASQAKACAEDALQMLDTYNAMIVSCVQPDQLARPAPNTCRWCAYHGVCDALWKKIAPAWEWTQHAIEGIVEQAVVTSRATVDARIIVERGSMSPGRYRLRTNSLTCGQTLVTHMGKRVRVTHLRFAYNQLVTTSTSGVWICDDVLVP